MSYILDALKKAESERRLGSVPNVHAQPVVTLAQNAQFSPWKRLAPWTLGGLLVLLVAALAWTRPWSAANVQIQNKAVLAPEAQTPKASVAIEPAPAANSSAETPPTATAPLVAATPAPLPPAAVKPASAVSMAAPVKASNDAAMPRAQERTLAKTEIAPRPEPVPVAPNKPSHVSEPQIKSVKESPASRIGTLRDLPPHIQKEIPAIAVNGYLYASKPVDRSMLINNKLLREGEQVAPGLTLEEMLPKEAILNYMGYRFRVSY